MPTCGDCSACAVLVAPCFASLSAGVAAGASGTAWLGTDAFGSAASALLGGVAGVASAAGAAAWLGTSAGGSWAASGGTDGSAQLTRFPSGGCCSLWPAGDLCSSGADSGAGAGGECFSSVAGEPWSSGCGGGVG